MRDVVSIRYALLVLLSEAPRNSRQLGEALETRPGRMRAPPAAQVNTTLRRLERDALVESGDAGTDGPETKFLITADGERELARWLRTPPDLAACPRFRLDSVIRWLDAAGSRLMRAAARPPADDHIRTSEADREDAAAWLRHCYAEGRLTYSELGERLTAALTARTFGDLRRVLADLPAPIPHSATADG